MPESFLHRLKPVLRLLLRGESSTPASGALEQQAVPALTLEEAAEARQFFPLPKYFIFGHARSGTTLLTRLVRLHPMVHCNYQAHFFTRLPLLESLVSDASIRSWLSRRSNRWNRGRDLSPVALRSVSDFIMEREARQVGKGGPGCIVGDKSPNSLLDGEAVRLMNKVYPDGKLVFIVRDGRDAALSHRFQAFIENPAGLPPQDRQIREAFAADPAPFMVGQRSVFTEKAIRSAAEGWVKNVVETHNMAQGILGERYFSLRYEDVLSHPLQEMRRLWAFLGVDAQLPELEQSLAAELAQNPDADWQQQKAGEIASPLTKGKRGTWQEIFTTRDRQVFQQVAGQVLKEWKYEES